MKLPITRENPTPSPHLVSLPVLMLVLLLSSQVLAQQPEEPTDSDPGANATVADDIGAIIIQLDPDNPNAQIRVPLAVPDSMNLGTTDPAGIATTISNTLRRDLELAGYFQIIGPTAFHHDQHADGMTESTINFQNWFNVGAQGLIKTAFRVTANQVRLDFRLFNVDAGVQVGLAWQPVTVGFNDVRRQVHDFANQVVSHYSGHAGGPFGGRIVFVGRGEDGSTEIYTMTIGDDGISPVTNNHSTNMLPRWAGNQIIYTSYVNDNPDLYVTMPEDQEDRLVSNQEGFNIDGDLSSDGRELLVSLSMDGNSEIYVLDFETGEILRQLTDNLAEEVSPVWSPSGRRIAFVSDRSGGPQIYTMNADGTDQRRVTFAGRYNTTPDWSPDGQLIAFTGRDSRNRFDIFTVDVSSSHIERLTQDQGHNEHPSWSGDGQYLVFQSTRGGESPRLYLMTADGNSQVLLTRNGSGFQMAVWRR